jgi:hypothetical protein
MSKMVLHTNRSTPRSKARVSVARIRSIGCAVVSVSLSGISSRVPQQQLEDVRARLAQRYRTPITHAGTCRRRAPAAEEAPIAGEPR